MPSRRTRLCAVVVLAFLTGVVAAASAQAPGPIVTITGFVDQVSYYSKNLSLVDLDTGRTRDREWYARTRIRPDLVAAVGTTRFVLGLEIDEAWGQVGAAGKIGSCGGTATGAAGTQCSAPQRFGTTAGWDLNTDTQGVIELKWAYTEFDAPGIPVRLRLGAQPFTVTYKAGVLATGDFAGVHATTAIAPWLKLHGTFVQLEEAATGRPDGFTRGEDIAFIGSAELSPRAGVDIRPTYAYFEANGPTSTAARQGRGGLSTSAASFPLGAVETRHTLGVDARARWGAFTLDPTIFYQFGDRDVAAGGALTSQERSAWLADVRGGFTAGPLVLEAAAVFTTGNGARDAVQSGRARLQYFEPISTDTTYYTGWAEILALGVDSHNVLFGPATGLNPAVAIGYDRYGLMRLGARASYALTPAFLVRGAVSANWTERRVDTSSAISAAAGLTPGDGHGDARYLGTEVDAGIQYKLAPNLVFDAAWGWLSAGGALASAVARDPSDVQMAVARMRFTF